MEIHCGHCRAASTTPDDPWSPCARCDQPTCPQCAVDGSYHLSRGGIDSVMCKGCEGKPAVAGPDERDYQARIQSLSDEAVMRAKRVAHSLVSRPPLRDATAEVVELIWWALATGATQPSIIKERMRRMELASQ